MGLNSKVCVMQLKKISVILTIAMMIAIAAALSGCTSPTPTAAPSGGDLKSGLPATLDYSIQVTGGSTPVTLSYADLKAMELKELKGVSTVNSVGTETSGDFIGVPLIEIAKKAGLPTGEVSFKVVAADGYGIDYSMEQMNAGILALKTNGVALNNNINDDNNCIRIVIPGELKNMWLKMPAKIEVTGGAAKAIALSISGANVTTKKNYALDDLKAMPQKSIDTIGKDNATKTYTGVSLNALLDAVGPKGEYVQFISGDADGYNKTIKISDIRNSPDAIISIGENGNLKNVIPGLSTGNWVGNLTKIRID
ncbi:MAG: Oxidoreductase molybdopterin binding domain protein [Methanocella sp. PtaU1.Bin125]|nr:MAG: Oxidoreductase molybdopterin binding domain protein [Methanocella sp. PtaU1.Bin125]